jgi:hypothetical protein
LRPRYDIKSITGYKSKIQCGNNAVNALSNLFTIVDFMGTIKQGNIELNINDKICTVEFDHHVKIDGEFINYNKIFAFDCISPSGRNEVS